MNTEPQRGNQVEVTKDYLASAVKPNVQGEGANLKATMITNLLSENRDITVNRVFSTRDPIILEWYYNLAINGKFGERLAFLMSLDAYGKIKETTDLSKMSQDEKIDKIASTVALLAKNLTRTQKLTENTMTSQVKTLHYMQGVNNTVRGQGAILAVLEHCLSTEDRYTPTQIKEILENVKHQLAKMETPANNPSTPR